MSEAPGALWFHRPSDWSVLSAIGSDAPAFLNGFCTNDVSKLAFGEACEVFFTDAKAHVLAFAWVVRTEEGARVVISSTRAAGLVAHLDKYVLNSKVELGVETEARIIIVHRPPSGEGCGFGASFPLPALGEGVCGVVADAEEIDALAGELLGRGQQEMTAEQFHRLRIERGLPQDRLDVDERNLPQEVDRDTTAISFHKGCYLGQEPVARIDAMGHVNWLLRGVRFEGPAQPGDELSDGERAVARVTSVTADQPVIGLAYVRRACAAEGKHLSHSTGRATVCSLPMKTP